MKNLKYYLNEAKRNKYAIGQFNFSTLTQLRGILSAVNKLETPVILGVSEGELNYLGLEEVVALVEIAKARSLAPLFLHLDHGKDVELIKRCVDYGFSSVHFDGSTLPLEKNTEYAKTIVQYAHKKGVLVEGEMESIGLKSLASSEDIEKFGKETGIDSIAVAVGSVHGIAKVKLDFNKLKDLGSLIKDKFIVLHGGSGIDKGQIRKAINLGVVKVNINTEIRIAWKEGMKKALKKNELKPYKIVPIVENIIQKKVAEKIKLFGTKK